MLAHVYKFQLIQTSEGFVTDGALEPAGYINKTATVNVKMGSSGLQRINLQLIAGKSRR
jgi:hypothetical protein